MKPEFTFPHHNYQNDGQRAYELVPAELAAAIVDPRPQDFVAVAQRLRAAGVTEVILVHGTFAGDDILGIMREVARLSPRLAGLIKGLGKELFDKLAGEVGNFTQDFADLFATLINWEQDDPIPVTRLSWSGENYHLARAAGAISLLDHITASRNNQDERLLIWGHSHGGNLLAMMGQLMGASVACRRAFFSATRVHYRDPILRRIDLPEWERVRKALLRPDWPEKAPAVDFVTFGTPLRYRWNMQVCSKLIHFVHHRQQDSTKPAQARLPSSVHDILSAAGGDYAQQLGIGGTDFLPSVLAWRSWRAERKLRVMFESGVRRRDLLKNLQQGQRVSLDGTTMLVDYPDTEERWKSALVGHGIYTRSEWLPFHLNAIVERFY